MLLRAHCHFGGASPRVVAEIRLAGKVKALLRKVSARQKEENLELSSESKTMTEAVRAAPLTRLLAIAIPFTAWLMQEAPSGRSAGAPPASRVMWQIAPCSRERRRCRSRE